MSAVKNSPIQGVPEWRKRRASASIGTDSDTPRNKRSRYQYYYILADSPDDDSLDEGSESVESIQDKETDYCKDTTDTDTKSEFSDDDCDLRVEYEVVTSSDTDNPFANGSSSGEDVLVAATAVVGSIINDSEIEIWATDNEDESDSDISITESRLFKQQRCKKCKIRKTVNCFPLCSYCYQIRKNCYPPRPRPKKKIKEISATNDSQPVTRDSLSACLNVLSQDSGLGSSQELQSTSQELQPLEWDKIEVPEHLIKSDVATKTDQKPSSIVNDETCQTSSDIGKSPPPSPSNVSQAKRRRRSRSPIHRDRSRSPRARNKSRSPISRNKSRSPIGRNKRRSSSIDNRSPFPDTTNEPIAGRTTFRTTVNQTADGFATAARDLCIMCHTEPKNGVFVHSTVGHQCCCYKCAVKFWSKSKRCALCNLKSKNIIKSYLA